MEEETSFTTPLIANDGAAHELMESSADTSAKIPQESALSIGLQVGLVLLCSLYHFIYVILPS